MVPTVFWDTDVPGAERIGMYGFVHGLDPDG